MKLLLVGYPIIFLKMDLSPKHRHIVDSTLSCFESRFCCLGSVSIFPASMSRSNYSGIYCIYILSILYFSSRFSHLNPRGSAVDLTGGEAGAKGSPGLHRESGGGLLWEMVKLTSLPEQILKNSWTTHYTFGGS